MKWAGQIQWTRRKGYEEDAIQKAEVVIEIGTLSSSVIEFTDKPDEKIVQIDFNESNDSVTNSMHSE